MIKIIKSSAPGFENFFRELKQRGDSYSPKLFSSVAEIVSDVEDRGDKALFQYTKKFDGYSLTAASVEVKAAEKESAFPGPVARDEGYQAGGKADRKLSSSSDCESFCGADGKRRRNGPAHITLKQRRYLCSRR